MFPGDFGGRHGKFFGDSRGFAGTSTLYRQIQTSVGLAVLLIFTHTFDTRNRPLRQNCFKTQAVSLLDRAQNSACWGSHTLV